MIEALVFDCGGVFVAPTEGDWLLPPGYQSILGEDFIQTSLEIFKEVRSRHFNLLPDTNRINTDDEEYTLFIQFYKKSFEDMSIKLSDDQLKNLAHLQVYLDNRYILFEDVLPYLKKWKEHYKLGIVSDAPPSTRRILKNYGVMNHMNGATFSSDLGILKPNPEIYESTLAQIGVSPQNALFIDDYPSRLKGAVNIGMKAVQMYRKMPPAFKMPPIWEDGSVVYSFEELDNHIKSL